MLTDSVNMEHMKNAIVKNNILTLIILQHLNCIDESHHHYLMGLEPNWKKNPP